MEIEALPKGGGQAVDVCGAGRVHLSSMIYELGGVNFQ